MELSNYEYFRTDLGVLYCGDCLEVLPLITDKIDLVLTDPPYDQKTHEGGMFSGKMEFGNVSFEKISNYGFLQTLQKMCDKWILVFMPVESLKYVCDLPEYIRGGIWDRVVNSPQMSGDRPAQAVEAIAILHNKGKKTWSGGGKAGIWRYVVERGHKQHETQKPILLFNALLKDFGQNTDLVLDPFIGSGTTAVAAEQLNRRWIGIEISEKYCEIAKQRILRESGNPKYIPKQEFNLFKE